MSNRDNAAVAAAQNPPTNLNIHQSLHLSLFLMDHSQFKIFFRKSGMPVI